MYPWFPSLGKTEKIPNIFHCSEFNALKKRTKSGNIQGSVLKISLEDIANFVNCSIMFQHKDAVTFFYCSVIII